MNKVCKICGKELEKDHAGYYCSNKDCIIRYCPQDEGTFEKNESLMAYMEEKMGECPKIQ